MLFMFWIFTPLLIQGRDGDTSTAESGSDVDDVISPFKNGNAGFARLTPVYEEVSYLLSCCISSFKEHFLAMNLLIVKTQPFEEIDYHLFYSKNYKGSKRLGKMLGIPFLRF